MKITYVSSLILLIIVQNSAINRTSLIYSNRYSANEVFQQFFEVLRTVIRNGCPEADVPVLDPYQLDYQHFSFPGEYVSLKVNVSDGVISGLGSFQILPFSFNPAEISITMDIKFPLLTVHSEHYELHGDITEAVPIAGQGKIHLEVHDVMFSGKVYLKQSARSKSELIYNLQNPNYVINRIVSRSDFDGNIDDILNTMIEEVVGSHLNRFSKYFATTYSDIVVDAINNFLQKFEICNIIYVHP